MLLEIASYLSAYMHSWSVLKCIPYGGSVLCCLAGSSFSEGSGDATVKKTYYSPSFADHKGMRWRLKIMSPGTKAENPKHVACFLEVAPDVLLDRKWRRDVEFTFSAHKTNWDGVQLQDSLSLVLMSVVPMFILP